MAVPVMPLFRCDRGHQGYADEVPDRCPTFEHGKECGEPCHATVARWQKQAAKA